MKIEYVQGNLLETSIEHILQGVNARGVMGSGISKPIREKYPIVFEEYRKVYEDGHGTLELGSVIWVLTPDGKRIGNVVSQDNYGRDENVVYADYAAIEMGMIRIDAYAEGRCALGGGQTAIAMPLIGAGLARGSWKKIAGIIEARSRNFRPVVYLLDGVIPTT